MDLSKRKRVSPMNSAIIPPKDPKSNGKVQRITDKEIRERLKKIRKEYIKKIEEIKKRKDKPK